MVDEVDAKEDLLYDVEDTLRNSLCVGINSDSYDVQACGKIVKLGSKLRPS